MDRSLTRRCLIVADIHANAVALEAALSTPEAQGCDTLISLGDQINFGPEPARVMALLGAFARGREAHLLLGNHEERLQRMEEMQSYSWALLRWTERQLKGYDLRLPVDFRLGPVCCAHGTPGDPYRLVGVGELPGVLDALPEGVTHFLSGHNHIAWQVTHGGRTAFNPGSLGMLEEERGGLAPFGVLQLENGKVTDLRRCCAEYSLSGLKRAFVRSGCWREAPEMARVVLACMEGSEYHYTLRFMAHLRQTARELGLRPDDREAWQAADRSWAWPERMSSPEFWLRLAETMESNREIKP